MPWLKWKSERSTTMCAKHACVRGCSRLILSAGFLQKKAWGYKIWHWTSSEWDASGSAWRACETRSFVSAIKSWQGNAVYTSQVTGMLEDYRDVAPQGTVDQGSVGSDDGIRSLLPRDEEFSQRPPRDQTTNHARDV